MLNNSYIPDVTVLLCILVVSMADCSTSLPAFADCKFMSACSFKDAFPLVTTMAGSSGLV